MSQVENSNSDTKPSDAVFGNMAERRVGNRLDMKTRNALVGGLVTLFAFIVLMVFISPLFYMAVTSLKSRYQLYDRTSPIYPASPRQFSYDGYSFAVYRVIYETASGELTQVPVRLSVNDMGAPVLEELPESWEIPVSETGDVEDLTEEEQALRSKIRRAIPKLETFQKANFRWEAEPAALGTLYELGQTEYLVYRLNSDPTEDLALVSSSGSRHEFVVVGDPEGERKSWTGNLETGATYAYRISFDVDEEEAAGMPTAGRSPALIGFFGVIESDWACTMTSPSCTYSIYQVDLGEGEVVDAALLRQTDDFSKFIPVEHPEEGVFTWFGSNVDLKPNYVFSPHPENFEFALDKMNFWLLFRNTIAIAFIGMVGTLIASTLVAYGLSRFPVPHKNTIFLVLIATIILPRQVVLIPTYSIWLRLGLAGTWAPLLVPHFFGNAYNVFLLRQYFLTIPKELDEAATIDGAGAIRTLWSVFLPQAKASLVAVGLFHFFFAWNDFFEPLIYLSGNQSLQPIAIGLNQFKQIYDQQDQLIQAGAALSMILPLVIFAAAQRVFLKGIDLSGVQK